MTDRMRGTSKSATSVVGFHDDAPTTEWRDLGARFNRELAGLPSTGLKYFSLIHSEIQGATILVSTSDNSVQRDAIGESEGTLDRALAIVEFLRENCPWDRAQTAESLIPYLIEESQEVVEAIRGGAAGIDELEGELGDLLLNVAFQIVLAEEVRAFDRRSVVDRLDAKMRRRHPHLFGDGTRENWEALKARELPDDESILSGLPKGLDPLLRAHRIQEKLSGVGFDWEDAEGARQKVAEELEEMREALAREDPGEVMEEAGDLLFTAVNLARLAGVHASNALARANGKVEARFRRMEELTRASGKRMVDMSLGELDTLWEEVKAEARDQETTSVG